MRADKRKFHYVYKITRTDGSGKFYHGIHSTDDLADGYFGSGQRLWKSLKKHGKKNHAMEILEFLPTRKAAGEREAKLVGDDWKTNPLCMNLKPGGCGDDFVQRITASELMTKTWADQAMRAAREQAMSESAKKRYDDPRQRTLVAEIQAEAWKDPGYRKKMSEQARRPMTGKAKELLSIRMKNAQHTLGKIWVCSELHSKFIDPDELQKYQDLGYKKGRKW